MNKSSPEPEKENSYDSRESWPPYTYRDCANIAPETYEAFMEFLSTENTSNKVMELQPWISFCDSRCTFCYYPNNPYSPKMMEPYLKALKKELMMYANTKYVQTSEFDEIVLGGGTPSLMTKEQMFDLIKFCEDNFNTVDDYFIKITGSSRSFSEEKLRAAADYGVYQVDMGAQTFDDKLRKMLNLPDSAEHVADEIKLARKLGMCVCIDIMYNIPGQTLESWVDSVKKAIELDAEVDAYCLEVSPGTVLHKQLQEGKVPPQGGKELEKEMYVTAYELFKEAGYTPIGHDRYSRDIWHAKENCLNGWPWAGILTTGAGCFMGYLQRFSYSNIENAQEYIKAVNEGKFPIARLSESTEKEMMQKVMTKLYLRLPIIKAEFQEKFGKLPEDVYPEQLKRLQKKGLIAINDEEIKLTELGDLWKANIAWEFAEK
ncbi:MAG: coproporphyrinogen III oxidase family protein [Candidatus Bathyarchaeota archaeon]|nr:coproporphyrinogen III oxidase family protein [Candidatus Bathyarchaeota archaeon]